MRRAGLEPTRLYSSLDRTLPAVSPIIWAIERPHIPRLESSGSQYKDRRRPEKEKAESTVQNTTTQPTRVGIMGGTFDPIHNGHLVAGSEVADLFDLDVVIYVPTGQPWQKKHKQVSAAEDRYLMTVVATASNPRFLVSRVDIDRGGDTYTVDTLADIRAQYPEAELFFITGADALQKIVTWRDWEKIFDLAHFVGVTRPGYELPKDDEGSNDPLSKEVAAGRLSLVEIPAMAISSTDVRERATSGRPVWYLVPDGVVQYIAKHGMYVSSE